MVFKLKGLDVVTDLCYSYDSIFAYLSSAEAEKIYKTVGGWLVSWVGFEFIYSSSLCLSCSTFGCAKVIYIFCSVLELQRMREVPDGGLLFLNSIWMWLWTLTHSWF